LIGKITELEQRLCKPILTVNPNPVTNPIPDPNRIPKHKALTINPISICLPRRGTKCLHSSTS